VPLPAEISDFFSAVVQCVIDAPSAETTRPVHLILSGIGAKVLETLSPSSLMHLQGQLIKIVSRMDKDNHDMNALCLAILAQMASTEQYTDIASSISSITSGDPGSDKFDLFESARKVFVDKNVPKILDFAFGRARWACSPSVSETVAHRIEALELCKRTIEPTNAGARQSWLHSKSSLSRKVNEHINREGLHAEVLCTVGTSPCNSRAMLFSYICRHSTSSLLCMIQSQYPGRQQKLSKHSSVPVMVCTALRWW